MTEFTKALEFEPVSVNQYLGMSKLIGILRADLLNDKLPQAQRDYARKYLPLWEKTLAGCYIV